MGKVTDVVCMRNCTKITIFLRAIMIFSLILAIWKKDGLWIFGTILAIFVTSLPVILKKDVRLSIPWIFDLMVAIFTLLNVVGRLLGGFETIPGFIQITNFFLSTFIALIAFVVIYIVDQYWDGLHMDKYAMAFVVVLATIVTGVAWEFGEWIKDIIFLTAEQGSLNEIVFPLDPPSKYQAARI